MIFYVWVKLLTERLRINFFVIGYSIAVVSLFCVNLVLRSGFNLLLFMPVVAYFYYIVIEPIGENRSRLLLDDLVKTLVVAFIAIAIFEIVVKLTGIDFLGYKNFLMSYGDRRIDVLRVRTLFGSSLSTAALCIFFFIYFCFVSKSYLFLVLSAALGMMSGSRTAIALLMIMLGFLVSVSIWNNRLSIKALFYSFLSLFSFLAALVFSPMGDILIRSLTLEADSSFSGRSDTTIQTLQDLLSQVPSSLVVGLHGDWTSDSAITSIMAGSGMIAFFIFIFLFLLILQKTELSSFYKLAIVLNVLLGAMMIGDFFVPAVSFLYFLTLFIYFEKKPVYKVVAYSSRLWRLSALSDA